MTQGTIVPPHQSELTRVTSGHHAITRLEVRGGFLDGATIEFAAGLNCFIGGRGAGKTTALEFLRYGLGLMPDAKTERHRTIDGLVRSNLERGELVVAIVTRAGLRYTARRRYGIPIQVVNEMGSEVPTVLDRDQIFSADIFSQNEIEDIALDPSAQLAILDRFDDANIAAIDQELSQLRASIRQSAEELRRLDTEIDELRIQTTEAEVLREKLRALSSETGPEADRLIAAHDAQASRVREAQLPVSALAALDRLDVDIRESEKRFVASINSLAAAQGSEPNADLILEIRAEIMSATGAVHVALDSVIAAVRAGDEAIRRGAERLAARHSAQDADYRALLEASNEEATRSEERRTLQASLARAEAAAVDLAARTEQRSRTLALRRFALTHASELRDKRFTIRQAVASRLTESFELLRVTVEQDADGSGYCETIAQMLRGLNVKQGPTAQRLTEVFVPVELARILAERDIDEVITRCHFDIDRARKVVDALVAAGGAYAIEEVELADCPRIELKDGDRYKEASKLSTGQRCTTILPLLLLQSERPLLVDQPEDNLDNAFVYETVVKALRSIQGSRQIIFVTHNPNIPVLGEADRVFVFASDGQRSSIRRAGTVDECKAEIEDILEGGAEAFLERKTRYGH